MKFLPIAVIIPLLMVSCNDKENTDSSVVETEPETPAVSDNTDGHASILNPSSSDCQYTNPVIYLDRPDPSVFLSRNGKYYLYSTGSYLCMHSSSDLVNWTNEGSVFASRPGNAGYLWAPDMEYFDNHYVLYYSAHVDGWYTDFVNVATADGPTGPFTDHGTLVSYDSQGVEESIDQCFWEEDGVKRLFWGSFRGIYVIDLSDDGLSLKEGAVKQQVAGTLIEGTMIYKRDGYYYMIGSAGWYDGGASSTYHLVIARSENLLGPYVDKEGGLAMNNGFSEFLNASDEVYGPGHNSEILEMSDGSTWFLYHGWPADNPNYGRVIYLSRIFWDNTGWPYVILNKPSVTWDKPPVSPYTFTYSPVDYMDFLGDNTKEKFLYDTGYVPNENTRIEMKFHTYAKNRNGISTTGYVRRIFQTGSSGLSLYVSSDGTKFGYSAYGGDNGEIADHEFNTDYEVTATLNSLTINGETHSVSGGSTAGKWDRITLFSGTQDYPFRGRIYYFKIYEGDKLIHDFEPVLRNEDDVVMFHDTVSGDYYLPFNIAGFGYGNKL